MRLRGRSGAILALLILALAEPAVARDVVDYQSHLGPRFRKRVRQDTRFIIVHSTESRLRSALRGAKAG